MFFAMGLKVKFPVLFKYLGNTSWQKPLVMTEIKTSDGCLILKMGDDFVLDEKQYRLLFAGENPIYPPAHFKYLGQLEEEAPKAEKKKESK